MYYRQEHAIALARVIKARSLVSGNIYVFGSARHEISHGQDIDLLIEVDSELFLQFSRECFVAGIDHIAPIVHRDASCDGNFWNYFSPREVRSEAALKVLGVSRDDILKTDGMDIPRKALDIICLPVGWDVPPIFEELQAAISAAHRSADPNFMRNLRDSAVLIG